VPTSPQLSGIQILRGIAAVFVVVHHVLLLAAPDRLIVAGASGVDLFFVISGFIMLYVSFPAHSAPLTPDSFLFRRASRIYPLYWICLVGVIALWMVSFHAFGFYASKAVSGSFFIQSMLLIPTPAPLIEVSWTLSYEVFFYLIFAATLVFRSRVASALVSTFVIAALILVANSLPGGEITEFLSNPIMLEFCFGLLLALAWANGVRPMTALWSVPGFLVIAAAQLFVAPTGANGLPPLARTVAWGLPSVAVLAGFLSVAPLRNPWTRFAMLVGDASYAIYLTHPFVMVVYAKLIKSTALGGYPQLLIVPIVVGVSTALGIGVHIFIESPILAIVRNISRSRRNPKSSEPLPLPVLSRERKKPL